MVLLLFLVAVAVVYWVVPQPPAPEGAFDQQAIPAAQDDVFAPIATPGLIALGEALSRYGQGRAPGAGNTPVITEADRSVENARNTGRSS